MAVTKGDRIELIRCSDPYTRLEPGARGTVVLVDAIGTVHVKWDGGSSLGLIEGQDAFRVVERTPAAAAAEAIAGAQFVPPTKTEKEG